LTMFPFPPFFFLYPPDDDVPSPHPDLPLFLFLESVRASAGCVFTFTRIVREALRFMQTPFFPSLFPKDSFRPSALLRFECEEMELVLSPFFMPTTFRGFDFLFLPPSSLLKSPPLFPIFSGVPYLSRRLFPHGFF